MREIWADGITKIQFVPDLGKSPANVNRITGVMTISQKFWNVLPECHKAFILLHEYSHIAGKTKDEELTDALAFEEFIKLGYPLSCSIYALSDVLNLKNPLHKKRVNNAFKRALAYSYYKNNPNKQWQVLNNL